MSNIGKLKLEVILSAVDKMTGPLKKAISNNTQLAKTLKHSRDELKALNAQQANIEGLEKMRNSVSAAYRTAKQARQEAAASFEQAQKQANELATQFKQAQARATPQLQKYEEEKQRIVQLREAHMALQKAYKEKEASIKRIQARIGKKSEASHDDKIQLSNEKALLKSLQQKRREAGRELYSARRENNELREDMKAVLDTAKDLEKQFEAAKRTAQKLKTAHTEQAAATHQLRQSMKAAGKQFADAAQGQEHLQQRIQDANRALEEQQARLAKVNRLQAKQRAIRARYEGALQNRDRIAGAGASSMAAGSAVGLPVLSMVKDFSAYEDAMLGIARQVEGARDAGGKLTPTYYEMGAAIRAMSQQIPMATTELAALVEGGARMGIKGKAELLAFARTAALASTAFDLPTDQISEDLGKIANSYKIPIKNIAELGDTINWLDDNAQSKGADIIDVMQRIAGNTGSMSYKEAAALGSTFLSLGASSEVAATATKAMVRELATADRQPKRFQAGLQALGLSAKQVMADMAKDSTGTILRVMEAVQKLPATQRMGVVVDLFGKEYGDDAAKLADNLGEYRKQLALVNEARAKGSMQREGGAKNDTLSAKYQIAQNTLFNAKAALGESLRAPAIEAMTAISGVLKNISAWTAANPQLAATLMKAAAAAAIITTVLGGMLLSVAGIIGPFLAARFAMSMLGVQLGGLLPSATTASAALGKLAPLLNDGTTGAKRYAAAISNRLAPVLGKLGSRVTNLTMSNWGFGLPIKLANWLAKSLARLSPLLAGIVQFGTGIMQAFLGPLRVLGLLTRMLPMLGAAIGATPIGWLVAALTAGALLLYKFWGPLKGFVVGFVTGLASGLGSVLGPAFTALWGTLGKLWQQLKNLGAYLLQLLPFLSPLGAMLAVAFQPVKALLGWLWQGFVSLMKPMQDTGNAAQNMGQRIGTVVGQIIGWVASLPVRMAQFGVHMVQGLIGGINSMLGSLKSTVTGMADSVVKLFKERLGIHSPSRVFAQLGGWTMEGLGIGLDKGAGQPLASLQQLAGQLIERAKGIVLPAPAMATPDDDRAITRHRVLAEPPQLLQRITAALPAFQLPVLPAVNTGGMGNGLATLRDMLGKISLATGLAGGMALQPAAAVPIDTRPPVAVPRQATTPAAAPVYHIQIHAAPGMNETQLARLVAAELDRREREASARRRSRLGDND